MHKPYYETGYTPRRKFLAMPSWFITVFLWCSIFLEAVGK